MKLNRQLDLQERYEYMELASSKFTLLEKILKFIDEVTNENN